MSDDAIIAELEAAFGETTDPIDVVDVTTLDTMALLTRFAQVRQDLYELEEMLQPVSQEGRDLHSERVALLLEMHRRGLR